MGISLFSHRATMLASKYEGPTEPPVDNDAARLEAIGDRCDEMWRDPSELFVAIEECPLTGRMADLLVRIKPKLERLAPRDDDAYKQIVRELLKCADRAVEGRATAEVDMRAEDVEPSDAIAR